MKNLLSLSLLISMAGVMHPPFQKTSRLPLQKKEIILKSPTNYAQRFMGIDPKTGKEIYYDPKLEVVLLDAKSGKYALKWIGYDGKEKAVVYQRPDAIDVIVSASVKKISTPQFVYDYTVQNLATSGEYLAGFEVQTFSSDIIPNKLPTKIDNIFIGDMSNTIPEFKEGKWIHFAPLPPRPRVNPGQSITFQLTSSSPPGLVMCRVHGGDFVMKGIGEEMPQELENALPNRFEALPSGYTIGPIDQLKTFSVNKRAKYLRSKLVLFQQLGWIAADLAPWYEQNLQANRLGQVFKRATEDFKAGEITSELLAMIHAASQ